MFTEKHISSHNRVQAASNTTQTEWGTRPDPLRVSCRYMGPIFCHNQKFFQDVPSNLSSSHTDCRLCVCAHEKNLPHSTSIHLFQCSSLNSADPDFPADSGPVFTCVCVRVCKKGGGGLKQEDREGSCSSKVCLSTRVSFQFSKLSDLYFVFCFFYLYTNSFDFSFFRNRKQLQLRGGIIAVSAHGAGRDGAAAALVLRTSLRFQRRRGHPQGETSVRRGEKDCRRRGDCRRRRRDKRTSCVISSFMANLSGRLVRRGEGRISCVTDMPQHQP